MNPILVEQAISLLVGWLMKRSKQKKLALSLIKAADAHPELLTTAGRREWVLQQLVEHGLSEAQALVLIVAGVRIWRKMTDKQKSKVIAVSGGPRVTTNL